MVSCVKLLDAQHVDAYVDYYGCGVEYLRSPLSAERPRMVRPAGWDAAGAQPLPERHRSCPASTTVSGSAPSETTVTAAAATVGMTPPAGPLYGPTHALWGTSGLRPMPSTAHMPMPN